MTNLVEYRSWRTSLLATVLAAFLSGCSSPHGPETVRVTGTVTFDGSPIEGANVIFHPLDGRESALASQSITDAAGRFEMSTHVGGGKYQPGMVAGKYAVAITKLDMAAISSTFAPPKNMLPKKYANASTSGLSGDVGHDQENDFTFDLDAD